MMTIARRVRNWWHTEHEGWAAVGHFFLIWGVAFVVAHGLSLLLAVWFVPSVSRVAYVVPVILYVIAAGGSCGLDAGKRRQTA